MPSHSVLRIPSYRHHKPTNQAVVTLNGRDIYLGKWNTKQSRAEYDRLTGQWLAAGRCLPQLEDDLTVAELALRYLRFAEGYYVKNGVQTSTVHIVRLSLRWLRQDYGHTFARDFGPLALESLQCKMVAAGLSRNTVNSLVACIRRLFRWAVAKQVIPPSVLQAIAALPGLRKGRTEARDTEPVLPVDDADVDVTLLMLPLVVADMVRFQRYTGARPGEVCILRPCDLDLDRDVWLYRPESHKTEHHGRGRVIPVGPKAQNVVRPYLLRESTAYCFSPKESESKRRAAQQDSRVTPIRQGNRPGTNRKRSPKCTAGRRYNTNSYRRAIQRACNRLNAERSEEAAGNDMKPDLVSVWSPNQLRHSVGTAVRAEFGLEASQVVLGHACADVTQIYAERDLTLAMEVMRKIG